MKSEINIDEFEKVLRASWSKETCHHNFLWDDKELPDSAGHCRVTALLVQDYFGGKILYSYANDNKDWDHYWNILSDGRQIDLTRDQFPDKVTFAKPVVVSRKKVLSSSITQKGYVILKRKIDKIFKVK
jgi:hypothetical protein